MEKYIYRLIDEKAKKEIENDGSISFFRPIEQFKSEGAGFPIFLDIEEALKSATAENIKPTASDINKVSCMMMNYYNSLPDDVRKTYDYQTDVDDDLAIITTNFFKTYCSYFTKVNLEDKTIREQYIKENQGVANNKVAFIKIPIERNGFNNQDWNGDNSYVFISDEADKAQSSFNRINGVLRIIDEEYVTSNEIKNPYNNFNSKDGRKCDSFFKYLNEKYAEQEEIRLSMYLIGKNTGESTIAFNSERRSAFSLEENMFYWLVSIYDQAMDYPKNIHIKLKDYYLETL